MPIPIEPRSGELEIRAQGAPYLGSASAEDTRPGEVAFLGFTTYEPVPLSGGQIGLWYDPDIAAGPAEVFIDERYGTAELTVDDSTPGLVFVTFTSSDRSLNRLPGEILSIRVPTRSDVPPGSEFEVTLDPSLTFLEDRGGELVPLILEDDLLLFE